MKINVDDTTENERISFEKHGNTLFSKEAIEKIRSIK